MQNYVVINFLWTVKTFGESNSRRLSNFLETHIFWKFDHISGTYNQINYRNIWFAKVTIIRITIAQVLFLDVFSPKKTRTLMSLSTFQYSKPKFVGYSEITIKLITTSENPFNWSNLIHFIKHQKQQLDNFLEKYSCII